MSVARKPSYGRTACGPLSNRHDGAILSYVTSWGCALMAEDIRAGSVVQLASGGPRMTVEWVDEGSAYCQWFEGSKKCDGTFRVTSLRLSSEGGGSSTTRVVRG